MQVSDVLYAYKRVVKKEREKGERGNRGGRCKAVIPQHQQRFRG